MIEALEYGIYEICDHQLQPYNPIRQSIVWLFPQKHLEYLEETWGPVERLEIHRVQVGDLLQYHLIIEMSG